MASRWTKEELDDLRELYPKTSAEELAAILNERHGHGRTVTGIYTVVSELGMRKMPKTFWTAERRDFMREFAPGHSQCEIAQAFEERFGISITTRQVKDGKKKAGVKSGTVGGRFEQGHKPWCKGKTWAEFMPPESQERSRKTCFAKGSMPKNAQDRPIGYERIDCDGYTWVKIAERPSRQDCNDNWRQKSHIAWEQAHGEPVPDGCMIVFANHDKGDFGAENLVAVPRGVWAVIARNGYQYHDAESLRACVNLARLKSGIYGASMVPRPCKRCGETFVPRYPHQRTCDACLGRGVKP